MPKSVVSPKVQVLPVFDYDSVDFNKESEVHLDAVIHVPEKKDTKRIPVHMCLAIDCSGSMAGMKINSVKDTVNKLIKNLTEDDTLAIIGFSDNCWEVLPSLPMSESNRIKAKDSVSNLMIHSMTNLEEAIKWAIERAATSDKKKVSRIVLLTDGLPTMGDCSHDGLVSIMNSINPDISLSTFGYGSDYDPELLVSLSNKGRGNHFYIQNPDDCKKAFALELGGLLSLALQDIKVSISPSGNMEIKEFMSEYQNKVEPGYRGINGCKLTFTIDDLYYGESKHAVMKIVIPKASQAVCARPTTVCNIEIDCLDVETKTRIKISDKARIKYVKSSDVQKDINEGVKKQLLLIEAAKLHKEGKKKADAGDYNGAVQIYTSGIALAEQNAWFDGSSALKSSFSNMASNSSDHFRYSNEGSKMATSNMKFYTSNRATYDGLVDSNITYTSSIQSELLTAFENPDDDREKDK